jgi:hypothetical protein
MQPRALVLGDPDRCVDVLEITAAESIDAVNRWK